MHRSFPLWLTAFMFTACAGPIDPADFPTQAILDVKELVVADIAHLKGAAEGIQDSAPDADADGWNVTDDAAAVAAMKDHWRDARVAYERVEGAIAVLFPELDASTDERYDGFVSEGPDTNLFDGEGVTGVHAIERILWADVHSAAVLAFESGLTNYTDAAFPATNAEATDFSTKLTQRLIDDADEMERSFEPLALDLAAAYEGVVGSMAEQVEKINLAQTGEAESRYAEHTLEDMRANLAGGLAIDNAYEAWIVEQEGGADQDAAVRAGFTRVQDAYDALSGSALPEVPATWNPDAPTSDHLATDYGQLWSLLQDESNPDLDGSLVSDMVAAAALVDLEINP